MLQSFKIKVNGPTLRYLTICVAAHQHPRRQNYTEEIHANTGKLAQLVTNTSILLQNKLSQLSPLYSVKKKLSHYQPLLVCTGFWDMLSCRRMHPSWPRKTVTAIVSCVAENHYILELTAKTTKTQTTTKQYSASDPYKMVNDCC